MRSINGFTIAEMVMTLAVGSIVLAMASKPATSYVNHTHANRAAIVLSGDLELARSAAVRQREPVRISFDSAAMTYTVTTRNTGTVLRTRVLGPASDFKLTLAKFAPASVDVFPNGISSAALTVTVGGGGYVRTVTMSRVGMVRAP